MSFQNLQLSEELLKAVEKEGFKIPTPIQIQAIPRIVEGRDIKASANTGTGKTAAFLLPALMKVAPPPVAGAKGPRVLILVPTRELAEQVLGEALRLAAFLPKVKSVCIYGGVPFPKQRQQLSKKVDILIATPGRLIDHLERGRLDLSTVELFILDEADRMLDMGFFEPVQKIYSYFPTPPQALLFSATLKGAVDKLSKKLLSDPVEICVDTKVTNQKDIAQRVHFSDCLLHKNRLLEEILSQEELRQAIVFTSTKRFAADLLDSLIEKGHRAATLHGDMCQKQRNRTMKNMRDGKIRVLVATDVAARGLDVDTISHVINFDLPTNAEDYVHRIGRTGRAGAKGVAISLVGQKDHQYLQAIEKFTGEKIAIETLPGLEPKMKLPMKREAAKSPFSRSKKPQGLRRRKGFREASRY